MDKSLNKIMQGYKAFRKNYALGEKSVMQSLSSQGQKPEIMVIACCDSRVDPAVILQCDPGDLFVVRNVANIVPPCEIDDSHHGTSAALEFGVRFLNIKHLILLGHSQCGGVQALLDNDAEKNNFISNWVSLIKIPGSKIEDANEYAKVALIKSYQNCLTFPWLYERVMRRELAIHLWFFCIKAGKIFTYNDQQEIYQPLGPDTFA